MKNEGRYDVSELKEAQYEPGFGDKVLRNLQGVIDPEDMDSVYHYRKDYRKGYRKDRRFTQSFA
jgi:hypothetical protein